MAPHTDPLRRDNHFVAASHLAAFSDDTTKSGWLWAYQRTSPTTPLRLRAFKVAWERDLYLRADAGGRPADLVERFLAESVEAPFAPIRDWLVYGPAVGLYASLEGLTADDRMVVARFLAFTFLRTPTERDATRWLGALGARRVVEKALEPGTELRQLLEKLAGGPLNAEQVETFRKLLPRLPQVRRTADDWLATNVGLAERLARLIQDLEWRLVRVAQNVELVTCDVPLVCARRGDEPGSFELGGGWREPDFEATLALSPSHVLYVTAHVPDEGFLHTEAFARSVRNRTIMNAQRWVYARSRDEAISDVLVASPAPSYNLKVNDRAYRVGDPVDDIADQVRAEGVSQSPFRYGVPPNHMQAGGTAQGR